MASYRPRNDKFVITGGQIIRATTAESLRNSLTKQLELREEYFNSELYESDIAITPRTIKLLCSDEEGKDNIPVTIGFVLEDETCDKIPDEYILAWVHKWDNHGKILLRESDVESVFNETNAEFSGFNVEFAGSEITSEYRDELKELYDDE